MIIFKRLSSAKNFLRPESAPLIDLSAFDKSLFDEIFRPIWFENDFLKQFFDVFSDQSKFLILANIFIFQIFNTLLTTVAYTKHITLTYNVNNRGP